ncbi:glycosyltransferase [candidate division GN15 bacterium]|nr:glycosyltransferase [candidate division GN15 bacterium]
MKILVLDEEFPWPPNTGKRIRTFNLLSRLGKDHEVIYLAYGDSDSESFRRIAEANMTPVALKRKLPPKHGPAFYARLMANLLSPYPYIVTSHYTRQFNRKMRELIAEHQPDIMVAEWTPYALNFKGLRGVKKVIVAHNMEYRIWRRYYRNETDPMRRWYIREQMIKVERFERRAFGWADGATAVASAEAEEIRGWHPKLDVQVVENGVDLEYFHPQDLPEAHGRLVFTGSMDWRPNQDAVKHFMQEIQPLVTRRYPEAMISFVGRNPSEQVLAYDKDPRARVTGTVDDVRPYIAESEVYVVPLRIGGGSRLKILEALAMQKAVVSTSVGAEGLEVTPGENILIADTPEEFANQIGRLLNDSELRASLGKKGRELVTKRYGWDILARKLERFLAKVAEQI